MENKNFLQFPFYAKATFILIGLYLIIDILYIAQYIIIPLTFAGIISILLSPFVNFLVQKKVNRMLAVTLTIIPFVLLIIPVTNLIFSQIRRFMDLSPDFMDKLQGLIFHVISWISGHFNISMDQIEGWLNDTKRELIEKSSIIVRQTILSTGSILLEVLLIPVYIFALLFYKPMLLEFASKVFGEANHSKMTEFLVETKTVIQSYLIGLLIEMVIVATLYTIGLMIIGIDFALLLGIIAALLNIIPFLGGVIAVSLFMITALITKDSPSYALLTLLNYAIIHFMDNSIIIPKIVASKVRINALVAITVIFAGGALWGIPGMILFIPITAIVKIIFDRIEPLKPWGFLLGKVTIPKQKWKRK